jgi:hypothetical protein
VPIPQRQLRALRPLCAGPRRDLVGPHALGFVGRGKGRRVDFPLGRKPEFCNTCIDVRPMTITPCIGPMKKGQERLCGGCEGQLTMTKNFTDSCVWCELGKGFRCTRQVQMASRT